ncbi:ATP-binding protein [Planotetraspora kaengkrachanensis]|uniref:ATPase n=1 Tax=Planotetraspora kaengkrachanensis TaxID=575193 RepID=A0A8J3V8G4_9ACTN|nr:ATP-binding protein [Planotetraspora kaengkrachanensis]GIG82690.1 ATPase [Planotetraspora kaengkrachanensis]
MTDPSMTHLFGRLGLVERRVRGAVAAFRARDPLPDDPFRGLYLSDRAVDEVLRTRRMPITDGDPGLADVEAAADRTEAAGGRSRLRDLAAAAALGHLDVELLLTAMLPDVDSRYEQLYGYLNDDVTRRRATAGLALRLCGMPEASAHGRARLDALAGLGLLVVEEPERPLLSRTLRVPDRVVAHLLGDDRPDTALAPVLTFSATCPAPTTPGTGPAAVALPGAERLARAVRNGVRLIYLRERSGGGGRALAVAALSEAGAGALCADAAPLTPDLARSLYREALLTGRGIVLGPISGPLPAPPGAGVVVILYGTAPFDPHWSATPPLPADVEAVPATVRAQLWRDALNGLLAPGVDPDAATAHFTLGPQQITRAAAAAALVARAEESPLRAGHLRLGARAQNAGGLERLARRIEPAVGWDDLVLPTDVTAQLRELAARARHRDTVLGEWRMRPGGGRGRGVTALFAGDSGTGKTMSAEVIAASLGLDLYTVNLATVVDKYVGETEKNLERIFAEASGVNGVLLFDEADAIFGRRSEVRDAHDRYANIESAYLLQRMETFDGLAILATNLRANLDEAFTRRLDQVVDFPVPSPELRRTLWDRCLGARLPRDPDVDLGFLACSFELAGGHIRSVAITAAYLAATSGEPVRMADVVGAVAREYRKLGRLCLDREFGPYLSLVSRERQ